MFVQSGEEFEKFVAQVFVDNGHHAEVTTASGDFGVDLVLNGEIAVQAKFYGAVVGPSAVQEVAAGSAMYGCTEAWVVTNSTFTPAAMRLAEANGVRVIAGEELRWLAENPDRSTDHGERYRAHLGELEKRKHEELFKERDELLAGLDGHVGERARKFLERLEAQRKRRREAASTEQADIGSGGPSGPPASGPPAGWYSDPEGSARLRW